MDGKGLDDHWLLGESADFSPAETLSAQKSGEVTIEGNLNKVNLVDIFKTITESKLVGTLYITRGSIEKCLFFRRTGLAIDSVGEKTKKKIGETLMDMGFVTMDQLNEVLIDQSSKLPIGQKLIAKGYITQAHVDMVVKYDMKNEVYEMFQWRHADFRFFQGEDPKEHADIDVLLQFTGFDTVEYLIRQSENFQILQRLQDKITFILRNEAKEVHLFFAQNRVSLITLYAPKAILLGQILLQQGFVNNDQINDALEEQKTKYRPLGEILSERGFVTRNNVEAALQEQVSQELLSMFSSPTIRFSYVEGKTSEITTLQNQLAVVDFDNLEMILSAFRPLENLQEFYSILPNAFGILPFQAGNIIDINEINLYQATQEIYQKINRPFNIQDLPFGSQMNSFQIAIISSHLIKDAIYQINNDIRELTKLYKINAQWENYVASLELQFTFSPREIPVINALAEYYETHKHPQRAGEFYLLIGDLNTENVDQQLLSYKKVLLLSPSKEIYQKVIQLLMKKEQFWDAGEMAKQYLDTLSPEKDLLEIEDLSRTMIKLKSNVEYFLIKMITIYKDLGNTRAAFREQEALKSYYREEGREEDVARLEKEILQQEESVHKAAIPETQKTKKRKKSRPPMSPILKAILSVLFLFTVLLGGAWTLITQYPEVFEQLLQKIGGATTTLNPHQKEMESLLADIQSSQVTPSISLLQRLLEDSQNFLKNLGVDETKYPEMETRIKSIIDDLRDHLQLLNRQKENLDKANKLFKEDYPKAESLYLLVTKEIRGDSNFKEEALKKMEQIRAFNARAESASKDIQEAVLKKNLPAAWVAAQLLLDGSDLHPTAAFKAQRFPFLVMIYPPLPVSYKEQELSEYPKIVYEKADAFEDSELKPKQSSLFDITPFDPKKRLNLDITPFKDFGVNNLINPWIKLYQTQHKISWKLALEKGGKVLHTPIERDGDMIFSSNRTIYRVSGNGKILKQIEMPDALTEVSGQILDMGDQLVVFMQNGKIYLLDPDSLQILLTYTELFKPKGPSEILSTPVRISKNSFVIRFQGMVHRFKIEDKAKLSSPWKWQLSNVSDGQLCYREKVNDKDEDTVYLGGNDGHLYEIPVNKKISTKIKPLYTLENADDIVYEPILLSRQQLFVYSKTGQFAVLSSEGKPLSQFSLPGKPVITRFVQEELNGPFYSAGSTGLFYRLQPQERGEGLLKDIPLSEGVASCPPVFLNKKIYVGMSSNQDRGAIHCLSEENDKLQILWTHLFPENVACVWVYQNSILVSLRNGEIIAFPE